MPDPRLLGRHDSWDGVRAVVAGFGVTGFAAADTLTHLGAAVVALGEKETPEMAERAELLGILGADVRLGAGATSQWPPDLGDVDVLVTSSVTGEGVSLLRERLEGRSSGLVGHSGVGKSSLLRAVEPTHQNDAHAGVL